MSKKVSFAAVCVGLFTMGFCAYVWMDPPAKRGDGGAISGMAGLGLMLLGLGARGC